MLSTGACRTGTKPRARTRPELSGERRKKIGAYWPDQHCVVWRKDFHGQPLSGAVTRSANWRLTALAANEATVTFVALS